MTKQLYIYVNFCPLSECRSAFKSKNFTFFNKQTKMDSPVKRKIEDKNVTSSGQMITALQAKCIIYCLVFDYKSKYIVKVLMLTSQ